MNKVHAYGTYLSVFIFAFVLFALPMKQVGAATANAEINSIQNSIQENTPDMVSGPIIKSVEAMEMYREKLRQFFIKQKTLTSQKIHDLTYSKVIKDKTGQPVSIMKPVYYAELHALTVSIYICATKWLFYIIFISIIAYMLRAIINAFL